MKDGSLNPEAMRASLARLAEARSMADKAKLPSFLQPPKIDPDAGLRRHMQWHDRLVDIINAFPAGIADPSSDRYVECSVEQVFSTGEFHGVATVARNRFDVYARVDDAEAPTGCTCDDAGGNRVCLHQVKFVDNLLDQLEYVRSSLSRDVIRGNFAKGKPSYERFEADLKERVLRRLNALVEREAELTSRYESAADDSLPILSKLRAQRVVWNFQLEEGYLIVNPVLQMQKKRGDGFTKGKKIGLDRIVKETTLPLTDADRRVAKGIRRNENNYYFGGSGFVLDPFYALPRLVNESNVLFENEPFQIVRTPMCLSLLPLKQKGKWAFGFTDEYGKIREAKLICTHDAFLSIDTANRVLYLGESEDENVDLMRDVVAIGVFEDDQLDAVIQQVRPLQKRISLRLPESHAGPILCEHAKLALLLRTRSDGAMDYGIRFRDAAGMLRCPAADPMIVTVMRDGKSVQVQRSAAAENQQVEKIAEALDLEIEDSSGFGTIGDFRTALDVIERLKSSDLEIEILWDKSSEKPISVLGSLSSKNVRVDITSKRNWFGISGECDFGDKKVPLKELLNGITSATADGIEGDFIRIGDGGWARISDSLRKRLKRLHDATHADRQTLKLDATAAPAIRELMDSDIEIKAAKSWQKCLTRLDRAEKLNPKVPKNLDATLRDYQIDGYKWMRRLAEWGVGGILADDMGLGKTLQTLAVLLDRSEMGPSLVIAPTSVGFNWAREAGRFAPDLNVHLYRETEREEFLPSVGPGNLVVCSYGLALRDAAALASVQWGTIVLDEAQAIKNSRSKTSKAIAALQADWIVALTGTPVENHLGELWSLFHVVSPGVFGGWDHFRKRFALPIEKQDDQASRTALAERLKPFVLRRTKSEVLSELPPRTEVNLYVDLSSAERAEYEKVRRVAIGEIEQLESQPEIKDQRFKILAMLTRLRQISCHVGLVNENWTASSAKLEQLCETLDSLREEGHRALVFSQFTAHLALIRTALDARGITYEYLDGSTPATARQQAVDRFQQGTADAFLISLKAGGTGLNLTAADYVIHMDPWWNPAVEDQATDRAHRYGQDKPVMVYRIIAKGTIEEEILAMHESKRDLVAGVMEGTEAAAKLSNDDLIRMIRS
ncbi:DEAD/DEAH box helicase [Novipirellula caenicola]|uniref:RNA polymerase-associated protein RapA n=1 Tax=Novipirellula caenicola TaxID=1536901 RepID=A0ABP9VP81_9BACT